MKYADALPKVRELGNKQQEHADAATLASRTYSATMELYNIAAAAGDDKAMQQHRDTLHTTLDIILDSGAMIEQIKAEQKIIVRQVHDWPEQ